MTSHGSVCLSYPEMSFLEGGMEDSFPALWAASLDWALASDTCYRFFFAV
jgi:hypothetical protein